MPGITHGEPCQPQPSSLGKLQLAQNEAAKAGGFSCHLCQGRKVTDSCHQSSQMSPKLRTLISTSSAAKPPRPPRANIHLPASVMPLSPPPQVPWGRMGTEVGSFTDRLRQSASRSPGTGTPSARPGAGKEAAAAGQPW